MSSYKFKVRVKFFEKTNWDELPIVAELIVHDSGLVGPEQIAKILAANAIVEEIQVLREGEAPRYFINMEK